MTGRRANSQQIHQGETGRPIGENENLTRTGRRFRHPVQPRQNREIRSAMDYSTAQAIARMLTSLPPESQTEIEPPAESIPAPQTPGNPGVIFEYQRDAFKALRNTAKAFAKDNWFALPVLPRWHCLLIGATGTGKSHLIHALARFLCGHRGGLWPVGEEKRHGQKLENGSRHKPENAYFFSMRPTNCSMTQACGEPTCGLKFFSSLTEIFRQK